MSKLLGGTSAEMFTETSVAALIVIAIAAFLIGLSKGGLGGAIVAMVTPLLTFVLPARTAVGIALPMLLVGDVYAVLMYWKRWRGDILRQTLPGTALGVLIGSLLLPLLSSTVLRKGIALLVLAYCTYRIVEPSIRRRLERRSLDAPSLETRSGTRYAPLFGLGTGLASTIANSGGPIISIYFLMQQLTSLEFIATSSLYYLVLNSLKVPGFLLSGVLQIGMLWQFVWTIPVVLFGVWSGKILAQTLLRDVFDQVMITLLTLMAIFLLVS